MSSCKKSYDNKYRSTALGKQKLQTPSYTDAKLIIIFLPNQPPLRQGKSLFDDL
jgi:hypothetical protein